MPDRAKEAVSFFSIYTRRLSTYLIIRTMSFFAGIDRTRFGVVPRSATRSQAASPPLVEKERVDNEDVLDTADTIDPESQSIVCREEGAASEQGPPASLTRA